MKKAILFGLLALGCLLIGSEESSRRGITSGSASSTDTHVITKTRTDRVCRNMYSTQVIVVTDQEPVYITVQLESVVHIEGKKVEFVLRLWEIDKLLTTKRVSVNW